MARILHAVVILDAACLLHQSACPTRVERMVGYDVLHRTSLQRGPRQLFVATSCRIALSRLSLATNFFSRAFSSCSTLSSRTWSDYSPAYCFFQR